MTRRGWDGINADAAKIRAVWQPGDLVGFYVAGNSYIWTPQERALFPPSALVSITLTAAAAADVLDVERGGANPADTRGWIAQAKAAGYYRPTVYCSRLTIPAVRQGTGQYILGRDYDIWAADYTGTPHQVIAPGTPAATCAATQYESTPDYDLTVVYDDGWPHRKLPGPTRAEALAALAAMNAAEAVLSKYVAAS